MTGINSPAGRALARTLAKTKATKDFENIAIKAVDEMGC